MPAGSSTQPDGGSPAASPAKIGSSVFGAGATKLCANCQEECTIAESCAWGRNGWSCHPCKTNYNRNSERCKTNAQLRDWWKGLGKDNKQAWYRRNKRCYEPNKRHAFDDAGLYTESHGSEKRHTADAVYNYVPMDDWIIREVLVGRVDGATPQERYEAGMEAFKRKMQIPGQAKKRGAHGELLIGIYAGEQERVGTKTHSGQEWKRHKTINDTVDNAAVAELSKKGEASSIAWLQKIGRVAGEHFKAEQEDLAFEESMIEIPAPAPTPRMEGQEEIRREVLASMQREAQIADAEELDDHEAASKKRYRSHQRHPHTLWRPAGQRNQFHSS